MALDADVFTAYAMEYLQEETEAATPEVVKSRSLLNEAQEDGSVEQVVFEETGPPEINKEVTEPMMKAIGRAIVEFLKHSEVTISDVGAGAETRIGRVE